jgi:hypothetical protein
MTESELDQWPPANCPPLELPTFSQPQQRDAWYKTVLDMYAALWDTEAQQVKLCPVSEQALQALESRLGCTLPNALRHYHLTFGVLNLSEGLCGVEPSDVCIQPLLDAYPGIVELTSEPTDLALAKQLITFSDYLGNGNQFCFHPQSQKVYYFDHEAPPMHTLFFNSTQDYLDAVLLFCLAEVHENRDEAERILVAKYGLEMIRKWLY